jgi:hypothetical protein
MAKDKKQWPVVFETPIPPAVEVNSIYSWSKAVREHEEQRIYRQRVEKLNRLLDYLQIDRSFGQAPYFRLALALAIEFLDGFKIAKKVPAKRGRKATWKAAEGAALVAEVQAIAGNDRISINAAIKKLIALDPKRYGYYDRDALKARYYEARKRYAKISKTDP